MDDKAMRDEISARLPKGSLLDVQFKRHDNAPIEGMLEPGEMMVVLIPRGPDECNAEHRKAPHEVSERVVQDFVRENDSAIQQLRRELPSLTGERVTSLHVGYGNFGRGFNIGELPVGERGLVPVMTRLGKEDLGTLDLLMAGGIASSRAEAVRWCLARIRERPTYQELEQSVRRLKELKATF